MAGTEDKRPMTSLKMGNASTFFMVPFYYDGNWEDIHKTVKRWEPQNEELYKEDILFPYIMELFKFDNQKQVGAAPSSKKLEIYKLKTDDKGTQSQFFFDRILGKWNVALIESDSSGRKNPYPVLVKFINEGNGAPHLFISPSSKIGIMTFCIMYGENCTIKDLQNANYALHKRNEIEQVVVGEKTKADGKKIKLKETRTTNYRCICPAPETNTNMTADEVIESVSQYLSESGFSSLVKDKKANNANYVNWDLNFFIGFLLNSLGKIKMVNYFNSERIHLYTFCTLDDSLPSENSACNEYIYPEVLRLSRVVNDKYLLPFEDMLHEGVLLQTYDNIYFSSAIEGTSMVCVAKAINKAFINNMKDKFIRQYLLIYILVLFQRYTLLDIDRQLTEIQLHRVDDDGLKTKKVIEEEKKRELDNIWNLLDTICRIKVNCYYTDVSIYTHHSQFYQHCCKNLHVPETFKEVDEKVELLKLTTDRRLQQLLEEQSELQKKEKNDSERRQHILSILVALLTIAQVIQAVYEIINPEPDKNILVPIITGAICAIALIWISRKDLMDFITNINN